MKKTGSFSHFKNIFLDRTRMEELYTILMKYSHHLKIEAKTIDGASVVFESYDELLEYTNYKKDRLRRLEIRGYPEDSWDNVFDLTFPSEYSMKYSAECSYNFRELDKETVFCHEVQNFLDRASSLYIPAAIGKFVSLCLIFFVLFFLILGVSHDSSIASSVVGGIAAMLIHEAFLHCIWYKLFPLVSFSWGESITYYKNIAKLRNFIFIGIFLAIAIGLFVNYISNYLFIT